MPLWNRLRILWRNLMRKRMVEDDLDDDDSDEHNRPLRSCRWLALGTRRGGCSRGVLVHHAQKRYSTNPSRTA